MKRLLPFLKNLANNLKHIKENKFYLSGCTQINWYAMDESRFGLMIMQCRIITAKGIKPKLPFQHRFQNTYLFGAFSPINGDHFTLEFPYCNGDCFQQYLDELSIYNPQEFKILILDNGAFHKAKSLKIPHNIELLFLPPYSPELNPAEQMWRYLKDRLANTIFESIEKMSDEIAKIYQNITDEIVHSITGWNLYKTMPLMC